MHTFVHICTYLHTFPHIYTYLHTGNQRVADPSHIFSQQSPCEKLWVSLWFPPNQCFIVVTGRALSMALNSEILFCVLVWIALVFWPILFGFRLVPLESLRRGGGKSCRGNLSFMRWRWRGTDLPRASSCLDILHYRLCCRVRCLEDTPV